MREKELERISVIRRSTNDLPPLSLPKTAPKAAINVNKELEVCIFS